MPIITNVAIFLMTAQKKQLYCVRSYIIGNLSLADIITVFISYPGTVKSLNVKFEGRLNSPSEITFANTVYAQRLILYFQQPSSPFLTERKKFYRWYFYG